MGYTREDAIGRTSLELNIWENPEDRQRVVEGLKNHGYVENLEARFVGKDGKVREGLMSARIIRLNEENVIISITRDITEYKRSEEEKAKLEDQFRQSRKMEAIGTLAGGIAHDFNNILFPILGYSEMLKDELPPESTFHMHVDEIIKASMRARDLVMQILTFSRQDEDELKPMKLQPIIKEALKLLRASIPTTIVIKSNIDNACESVMANPTQVHQVIMNLATNAYHAMEENGGNLFVNLNQQQIEFDAILFPELETGIYAVLTVSDTGRGIEKEYLDRVFEPYFTTKEKGKGTGLGLSVVQGIVKKSKGAVRIHSEKDKGTEIKVYFPVLEKNEEAEKKDHIPAITGGTEKILLVDDEQSIVNAQRRIIEALGYTVTSTTKSTEAFEIFSANPDDFDLIITDLTMPDMTGITLAEKIKSLQPDIPVIICTGFNSQINEEKIKASGIQGFIQKPVRVRQLADTIRKALDLSKTN